MTTLRFTAFATLLCLIGCQTPDNRPVQASTPYVFKINYSLQPLDDIAEHRNLLAALDGFLKTKNQSDVKNGYWLQSDFDRFKMPYREIMFIESKGDRDDTDYFKPTLLNIVRTSMKDEFIIKLAFVGQDSTGRSDLRAIFNIVAVKQDGGYVFKSAFGRNLADWHRRVIGTITFFYRTSLDLALASRMEQTNHEYARQFRTDPIAISYYKCENPVELLRLKGFDYSPTMYIDTTGGRAEYWNMSLFAGNNSEWYPRELIPFYIRKCFGNKSHFIFAEGYTTYLAGTAGRTLKEILAITREFYRENPQRDIVEDLMNEYRIHGNLSVVYPLGGLLAQITVERHGFEGIKRLLSFGWQDNDFFAGVENVLGVKKPELASFLKQQLASYR
jgi:hypothetical protein